MERDGKRERRKRTKKHRVGSAKRGPRSVSEAERSDGLPVGAELRHEAGSVMCASAVGETKARTEMAAGWRKKKRAKGVDAGNRTADSQLLTWVNGLPTVSMPPSFAANLFLRRQRSSFLILLHSPDYTKRRSFRELEEISKIHN